MKKRSKKGLITLDVNKNQINTALDNLKSKGFEYFLIEELIPHDQNEEKYLCLERERDGITASVSTTGGVDIENNAGAIKKYLLDEDECKTAAEQIGLNLKTIVALKQIFDDCYLSFLEINPLIVLNDHPYFLDMAAQVDSAGQFFTNNSGGGGHRA